MMRYLLSVLLVSLWSSVAQAQFEFRNQYAPLSISNLSQADYIKYAKEWGYEVILGDPWSGAKAVAGVDAGLIVLFNHNAAMGGGKWANFRLPVNCTEDDPCPPNAVNIGDGVNRAITPQLMAEFDRNLCMSSLGATYNPGEIYRDPPAGQSKFNGWRWSPYQVKGSTSSTGSVTFRPNYRSQQGIDESVAAWMRLRGFHENPVNKTLYNGIYWDETRFPMSSPGWACYNPINGAQTNPPTFEAGTKIFFKQMNATFKAALEAEDGVGAYKGTTGNVWSPDLWQVQNDTGMFLDLAYIESSGGHECGAHPGYPDDGSLTLLKSGPKAAATGCGTQDMALAKIGVVKRSNLQVNLAGTGKTQSVPESFEASCRGAQLIMGRAAALLDESNKSAWGGWFGANHTTNGTKCTYLLRAIPNWDNLMAATDRQWNESTETYSSSNSFFNANVIYSRHRSYETNHRMYVMKRTGSPTITLKNNEKVVNGQCTTSLFFPNPSGTCVTGYFTQSDNTVSFGASVQNENGYILTVHRQPSLQAANIPAVDQLNMCWKTDDSPAVMEPASSPTGFIIKRGGSSKTITSSARSGPTCYHFELAAGSIPDAAQAVTIEYSGGNVTAGTEMINGAGKVPAANFGPFTATSNLGGGGGPAAVTTQTKYQWGHINGPPDSAPLYNNVNTQLQPSPGGLARLYIKYRNTTATQQPTDFPLYYAINPGSLTDPALGAPLTDDCTPTNVCYTNAIGVDNPLLTVERLASDEPTNVFCSVIQSAASVPILTLPAGSDTECVYVIKFGEALAPADRVYFYPRGIGASLLDGYTTSNLPHATMAQGRQDAVGGAVSGGGFQ